MEIINLGEADGLPPVDWAAVVEKLESGSAPAPDAHELPYDLAVHRQRGRQPACDRSGCALAG